MSELPEMGYGESYIDLARQRDQLRARIAELEKENTALIEACKAALPHHQGFHSEVGRQLRAAIERKES